MGSVLAAVSPAVVVPRMINLIENGYGKKNSVPELILAGSSCDDIFVIVLFNSFKKLVAKNSFSFKTIIQIPISIVTGIILGFAIGFLIVLIIRKIKFDNITNVILILGISFGMIDVEEELKPLPRKVKFAYVAYLILKQTLDDITDNFNRFLKSKGINFQFNTLGFVAVIISIILSCCWGIIHCCLKYCCNDEDIALEIQKLEEELNKRNNLQKEQKNENGEKEHEEEEGEGAEYEIEEEEEDDEGEEVEDNKEMTEEEKKKKAEEEKEKEEKEKEEKEIEKEKEKEKENNEVKKENEDNNNDKKTKTE